MPITNFSEAREALGQFYTVSQEYKLDTIRAFMEFLGNPQNHLRVVHVAGTSGKTSTAYYVTALLKAAGYNVGLTVSPHVDEINERVQINLVPLPEADFCRELDGFLKLVQQSGLKLSYFEVMVAFAYWYFAKINVDYAVIEVGLGGRIDGTNVVDRPDKVCIITDIGLDHTKVLGDSLPLIAAEKAGIITDHNEVFTHRQKKEVLEVFQAVSAQRQAALHVVEVIPGPELALLPLFQQHNFSLAEKAVETILRRENKTLNALSVAEASRTYIPARMEIIEHNGSTIIIDGAHNGQKLASLLGSVTARYPGQPIVALVAFVSGDEQRIQEGLAEIIKSAHHLIVTEFSGAQDTPKTSVSAELIISYLQQLDYHSVEVLTEPSEALAALLRRPEAVKLITGSFYLLNHIRPFMLRA